MAHFIQVIELKYLLTRTAIFKITSLPKLELLKSFVFRKAENTL